MSNQRSTIIGALYTLLDGISTSTGYNTTPIIYREREDFNNMVTFPALYLEETEPEIIEQIGFRQSQGTINLQITGAMKSTAPTTLYSLLEDVRVCLESTANAYRDYTYLDSIQPMTEPESDRRYFEASLRVIYFYQSGTA